MPTVSLPLTKAFEASSSLSPSPSPKQTGDQVVWSPRTNPKDITFRSKWRPLLLRAPKRVAEMVVGLSDELASSVFVSGQQTVGIELTFQGVENAWSCSDGFKFRVAVAIKEIIGLKLLDRVEPLLSVIIEHVFGVYDGNIEVLQSSANGGSNALGVVGLNVVELLHKFFELVDRIGVVTGRDAELLDIGFFLIRKFRHVGFRGCQSVVPDFTLDSLQFPLLRRFQWQIWWSPNRRSARVRVL
jgi:hypothetical protein